METLMGVRLDWLAVETTDKAALLGTLGLEEEEVTSDEFDAPLVCAEFPNGWLVIVSNEGRLELDRTLPLVSRHGFALGGEVEEHVMFSRLRAFRGQVQEWSVTRNPEADPQSVDVEGELPRPFEDLYTALATDQANDPQADHMFELPMRLGEQLCGYSYDAPAPVAWTTLERAPSRRGRERSARSIFERIASLFFGPR
jgi:hypothetical protein